MCTLPNKHCVNCIPPQVSCLPTCLATHWQPEQPAEKVCSKTCWPRRCQLGCQPASSCSAMFRGSSSSFSGHSAPPATARQASEHCSMSRMGQKPPPIAASLIGASYLCMHTYVRKEPGFASVSYVKIGVSGITRDPLLRPASLKTCMNMLFLTRHAACVEW